MTKAEEILKKHLDTVFPPPADHEEQFKNFVTGGCGKAIVDAMEEYAREEGEKAPALRWVKASERQPEHKQKVLAYGVLLHVGRTPEVFKSKYYSPDDFNAGAWIVSGGQLQDVTHWMPLPSAPSEAQAQAPE